MADEFEDAGGEAGRRFSVTVVIVNLRCAVDASELHPKSFYVLLLGDGDAPHAGCVGVDGESKPKRYSLLAEDTRVAMPLLLIVKVKVRVRVRVEFWKCEKRRVDLVVGSLA
jgi:hypothetical protein